MKKPILLVVLDGVGFSTTGIGDAVTAAYMPTYKNLLTEYPNTQLKAHGTAVGLPSDEDMGNSEVGHNAIGSGQIYAQGAKLVNQSIESGRIYESPSWNDLTDNCRKNNSTLHFIGLLSDGNVHSNIEHLIAMLRRLKTESVKRVRVHILLDGRDVPSTSALDYVSRLEAVLEELNDADFDAKIASGGGRMQITMDRYQANWNMVKLGWDTHVKGLGRQFSSATEAIETYRRENNGIIDQDLPAFVIAENDKPVGPIVAKDSVILFNFRGDRAIELSMAFDDDNFSYFDRGPKLDVVYAGMLQYDSDRNIPSRYLVTPPEIRNTLTDLLVANEINEYAISETQKYGHVTYFWNGNRSGKVSETLETYVEIPSDVIPFEQRPWMKSAEITDALIEAMASCKYQFLRCNYPNGDMVGHTGDMEAVIVSLGAVDIALKRLYQAALQYGYILVITADHGNADEMLEKDKKGRLEIRTAHSLNPVPFIICDVGNDYTIKEGNWGLANIAPTIARMLGLEPPECWEDSMI